MKRITISKTEYNIRVFLMILVLTIATPFALIKKLYKHVKRNFWTYLDWFLIIGTIVVITLFTVGMFL